MYLENKSRLNQAIISIIDPDPTNYALKAFMSTLCKHLKSIARPPSYARALTGRSVTHTTHEDG